MQIKRIEKEIRDTPYHKGTEHHIGRLRARLSKLKDKQFEKHAKGGGGGLRLGGASGSERGYSVKKQGDATVVLVGPPSVGKSTLLNKLTNANSKIAPYDFTTVSVIPGMMDYKNAKIQILDVPGLIKGAEEGKGRGREVLSVARGADLLILLCDAGNEEYFIQIENSLEKNGIRLNQNPPKVYVEKKLKGGIMIHSNIKQVLSKETIKDIAQELGIKNAEITIKQLLTIDNLIDAFSKSRVYVPAIYVVNKIDIQKGKVKSNIDLSISAEKDINLDKIKDLIWNKMEFIQLFLVRPDEEPSYNHPIIMKEGQTLSDVAEKIGSDFAEDKKMAKIWGVGAKFPGQEVPLSTKVSEGMQVRFI
jgi:small GTP-binding protein